MQVIQEWGLRPSTGTPFLNLDESISKQRKKAQTKVHVQERKSKHIYDESIKNDSNYVLDKKFPCKISKEKSGQINSITDAGRLHEK